MLGGPVQTLTASAGTGKTYTLVKLIADALVAGLPPERLLATTFTRKAAAELEERVRSWLVKQGRPDLAAGLLAARIGTVNAVCGTLASEHTFALGRSAVTEIIPEDRQATLFAEAAGRGDGTPCSGRARRVRTFDVRADDYRWGYSTIRGWRTDVFEIVGKARVNGIPAEHLANSADRSIAGMLALMPPLAPDGAVLDEALASALRMLDAQFGKGYMLNKGTAKALGEVHTEVLSCFRRSVPPPWRFWTALANLKPTKTDAPLFVDVIAAASAHDRHPRLAADLRAFINAQFACAAEAMQAYDAFKAARGLQDFSDQESLALSLLQDPTHADVLSEQLGSAFVDEFQDSSPIQLAIFSALANLVGKSAWVGDPKQSIYGFRQTDPLLVGEVFKQVSRSTGGETSFLEVSWRSRPSLCAFFNDAFSQTFMATGLTLRETAFAGTARPEHEGLPPPLAVLTFAGSNQDQRAAELARSIAAILTNHGDWPIPAGDATRRPRGQDIAVLCRTNYAVQRVVEALAQVGIRSAAARGGLHAAPEVQLALAVLRLTADAGDTLAMAEIVRFIKPAAVWSDAVLRERPREALEALVPFAAALRLLREKLPRLTPGEALDAVLHLDGFLDLVRSWGETRERFDRLETLRHLTTVYEDGQHAARAPATLVGLAAWLADEAPDDQPKSRDEDAVNILTYHGAKGLEWPIVMLTELESDPERSAFGQPVAEADGAVDWRDPLAGRWIRYWPWPYGTQSSRVPLYAAAQASEIGRAATERDREERVRVLYVGATRAQDYLVFARVPAEQPWLDLLHDGTGKPTVILESDTVHAGGKAHSARALRTLAAGASGHAASHALFGPAPAVPQAPRLPLFVSPSSTQSAGVRVVEDISLGERIRLSGSPDMLAVGEAFHRFVGADLPGLSTEDRLAMASRLAKAWGAPQLAPEDILVMSDRLTAFLTNRLPGAVVRREWPVFDGSGNQVVSGRIDLLVEGKRGFALFDHKSFPGGYTRDEERLSSLAGQLGAYGHALRSAYGAQPIQFWLHQPVAARMIRLEPRI